MYSIKVFVWFGDRDKKQKIRRWPHEVEFCWANKLRIILNLQLEIPICLLVDQFAVGILFNGLFLV